MREKRTAKCSELLAEVRRRVERGDYLETMHAQAQMTDRGITTIETQYVLKLGYHEKKKDSYAERFGAWNYAIRGFTLDGEKELRVVVTLNPEGVLVITAIDLAK